MSVNIDVDDLSDKLKVCKLVDKEGLCINKLKDLKIHKKFKPPKSQLQFYQEKNADPEILKYVDLQGKTFGEKYMEPIAAEWFKLDKRDNSSHDHKKNNKTIEQKAARYNSNGNDWKWQHIELKHEWDFLLLTGLDFKEIKFYIASRKIINQLVKDGVITGQGKKDDNGIAQAQQAYWFSRSDFKKIKKKITDYFKEIKDETDLVNYINNN